MGYTFKSEREPRPGGKRPLKKVLLWVSVILAGILVLGALGYLRTFRGYPPKELMQDIRAGVAARDIKDPDARFAKYLEGRFGSMDDPANPRKAFLAFFDPDHIRALQFLATHAPEGQQQDNINASAQWVEQYRNNLTPADRESLRDQLNSDTGRRMLRKAMAEYNSQDVYYRGKTAPVISQLLRTIEEVKDNNP